MINIATHTLQRGNRADLHVSSSRRAVPENQKLALPVMRVRHFNIAGVARSNFKPGINTNGRTAISKGILSIDVANVSAGVDEALVAL